MTATRRRAPFVVAVGAVTTLGAAVYAGVAWLTLGEWWPVFVGGIIGAEGVIIALAGHITDRRARRRAQRRADRWRGPVFARPFTVPDDDDHPNTRDC